MTIPGTVTKDGKRGCTIVCLTDSKALEIQSLNERWLLAVRVTAIPVHSESISDNVVLYDFCYLTLRRTWRTAVPQRTERVKVAKLGK